MKHPSVRQLYDYWNAQRGARAAPEPSEIEPSAIRRALADTFILAYDSGTGHSFRIAGTRLCAAFGRELRGAAFIDLWDQESRRRMHDLLGVVAREYIGIVAGARGRSPEGTDLDFELLVLPLRHRNATDARLLGARGALLVRHEAGRRALAWNHSLPRRSAGRSRCHSARPQDRAAASGRPDSPRPRRL